MAYTSKFLASLSFQKADASWVRLNGGAQYLITTRPSGGGRTGVLFDILVEPKTGGAKPPANVRTMGVAGLRSVSGEANTVSFALGGGSMFSVVATQFSSPARLAAFAAQLRSNHGVVVPGAVAAKPEAPAPAPAPAEAEEDQEEDAREADEEPSTEPQLVGGGLEGVAVHASRGMDAGATSSATAVAAGGEREAPGAKRQRKTALDLEDPLVQRYIVALMADQEFQDFTRDLGKFVSEFKADKMV